MPTVLLALIFTLSGLSSLVYQVVWQRLLTVHYGVGAVSITLIVTVFMFGLGLGGWLGGRLADRVTDRVRLYLVCELGLGVFGAASPFLLDLLGRRTAGASYAWTIVLCFLFLAVPTTLMGITLPVVVKILHGWSGRFAATVSLLYCLNTLGAALGALIAAYVLISFFGLDGAIYFAAAVNVCLALLILGLRRAPRGAAAASSAPPQASLGRLAWLLVFVTGFLAIGYEIAWFRLVGVLIKDSPYAFATTLAVYLFGVALGSFWIRLRSARLDDPRSLFFFLQFLLGASTLAIVVLYYQATLHSSFGLLTARSFAQELHPPVAILAGAEPAGWFERIDVLFWPAFFVLLPTCFMGAGFPLVASLAYAKPGSEGGTVGTLYFWNLLGNLCGGALTGLLLLPALGTERTLLAFSLIGALAILLVARRFGRRVPWPVRAGVVLALGIVAALAYPRAGELYLAMHVPGFPARQQFLEEGLSGVVVTRVAGPQLENHINGVGHGGRPNYAFVYEALETLAHAPSARNALVIGFGTGTITEVLLGSRVERITLVEVNEALFANLRKLDYFDRLLDDPRIEIVIDDARRFLLRTDERFDLILTDPLRTTTAYSNNLYSQEFFELVEARLSERGVFFAWTDEFQVVPRTLASVFAHVRLYSIFLLASPGPLERDAAAREDLLDRLGPAARRGVAEVQIQPVADRELVWDATALYPVNRDWRPVCEYYLGLRVRERSGRWWPAPGTPSPLGDAARRPGER